MDYNAVVDRLSKLDEDASEFIRTTAGQASAQIRGDDKCKIVDLIKGLNAVLTNGSYEIRCRGVELLAQVVQALPTNLLNEKEIELLTEFICLRLIDHKSMELPALRCLAYFVDCDNKPARYNKQLMEFIKTKANIRKMEPNTRHRVYELLKKFVAERKRLSNTMDGDFIYSLVTILEGENNPNNLMLCFGMISFILKNFDDLEPFIDDIFEWLTSYYPIDYTPSDENAEKEGEINIQRLDLVEALYECFYANPLNSENLQTMLLEKLESNVMSSKLESLECLIKCYEKLSFPLASIVKYNSTLWTALRMNCLRKIDTIEPKLLDTSLRALTALAKRLSEDGDMYFTFVSDMYEELAIAFRKPEMDLFEPAACLVTHAILPSVVGFNYVLDKILPIALNALEANELRPLPGLAYMFEKLHQQHPGAQLKADLSPNLTKLVLKVVDQLGQTQNSDSTRLLESVFSQKVNLEDESLRQITDKLWSEFIRSPRSPLQLDIEKNLALICAKYNKFDIITKTQVERYDLNTLIRLMYDFDLTSTSSPNDGTVAKFSVYLRMLTVELDQSTNAQLDALDQLVLSDCLTRMREQLESMFSSERAQDVTSSVANSRICEQSAIIHAILLNKLAPGNANQILMKFFSSNYCQNLVGGSSVKPRDSSQGGGPHSQCLTLTTYLPHVRWIFKSLVIRNHQLAAPLVNLVLNCIVSDKVHPDVAQEASRVFSFVLAPQLDDSTGKEVQFDTKNHYQIFSLYKQKFYMQTSKEAKLRYEQTLAKGGDKQLAAGLLIFSIASQLAHLPLAVYKRDHEWLIRQLLRVLGPATSGSNQQVIGDPVESHEKLGGGGGEPSSALFQAIYSCLEGLIHKDLCEGLVPFLPSLIDLNLRNACEARSLVIRRQALLCLARIATTFKESDLMVYRSGVVDRLRPCLSDKKRLVRQAAGETRLRWVTIGQPIGAT